MNSHGTDGYASMWHMPEFLGNDAEKDKWNSKAIPEIPKGPPPKPNRVLKDQVQHRTAITTTTLALEYYVRYSVWHFVKGLYYTYISVHFF